MTTKAEYLVIVKYDDDPDVSWLEQWDTPEKYYGGVPKCSHGKPMKYLSTHGEHTWVGDHEYLIGEQDEDGAGEHYVRCTETIEAITWTGEGKECVWTWARGLGGPNAGVMMSKDGKPVPFDAYQSYHGNPNRHTFLGYILEKREPPCEACKHHVWETVDSLWGIDFMDDDHPNVGTYDLDQIKELAFEGDAHEKYLFGMVWNQIQHDLEKK